MTNFQKPVSPEEPPHRKFVEVQRVESEKKPDEEKFRQLAKQDASKTLFAALAENFKKILSLFSSRAKSEEHQTQVDEIVEHLISLKQCFEQISQKDLSQQTDFIRRWSEIWQQVVKDSRFSGSLEKNHPLEMAKIKLLIDQVNSFPHATQHTVGYYLKEYAGKNWYPVPFLDLVLQLHLEHQQAPAFSTLQDWISFLAEIIASLQSD